MSCERLKQLIEALLFASPEPISVARLCDLLAAEGAEPEVVKKAVADLGEEYISTCRAYRICVVAGGYRLETLSELSPVIERLNPPKRHRALTDAAMEVLAIIAYRQPVGRVEIEAIRGVNCEAAVRGLLDRKLIAPVGRSEDPGRPMMYGTTKEFLSVFGLSSLDDLPRDRDLTGLTDKEATTK